MKTHDFFKLACTDLPDREAVAAAILARPAPRRRFAATYLATAAAAAIILAIGFAALPRLMPTPPTPAPQPPEAAAPAAPQKDETEPADRTPQTSDPEQPAPDPPEAPEAVLHFNDLNDTPALAADVGRSNINMQYCRQWKLAQVLDYLGCDPRPAELPEDLKPCFENSTWMFAQRPDGTVLWDQFGFSWREKPGSVEYAPLERGLRVTVSKSEIFTCGILISQDKLQASTLCGTELYLGQRQMPYGPFTVVEDGPNIPAGYYDVYVAQFEYNGLHYDVTADNLTQDEFIAVLTSVLTA